MEDHHDRPKDLAPSGGSKQRQPQKDLLLLWHAKEKEWTDLEVRRDPKAPCCMITTGYLLAKGLGDDNGFWRANGAPRCGDKTHRRAIPMTVFWGLKWAKPMFCVVESDEIDAVMTGREKCWADFFPKNVPCLDFEPEPTRQGEQAFRLVKSLLH